MYADTPDHLGYVLQFVPSHARLPIVHLSRGINVLHGRDRAVVREFADRFAGHVAGLVVHDKREMAAKTDRLPGRDAELDAHLLRAPGQSPRFPRVRRRTGSRLVHRGGGGLQAAERISCCIDVGHIGLRQATAWFKRRHPGLDLKKLSPVDDRLPGLVADVQDAVGSALPHVLAVIRSLRRLGKHVHFHLHDGHPLIPGLRDH